LQPKRYEFVDGLRKKGGFAKGEKERWPGECWFNVILVAINVGPYERHLLP